MYPTSLIRHLDEEVEKATETINVIAYLKPKDSEVWTKYDDIEGSVKIENDENVKILHIPLKLETVSSTGELYYGFTNYLVASFEKEERHEAYTIKFFGFKKQSPAEGRTYSWKADQAVPKAIDFSTAATVPENYISVWVGNNGRSCLKANPCPNDLAGILASFGGMVEVKIKLKN
jgi:hypothetical protein